MTYEVAEVNDLARFLSLEQEWNGLLADTDCDIPFLRHEWFRVWWSHFGPPHRLAVILVRNAGRLVLAAPLMEVESRLLGVPFRKLQSMTNKHSFRFNLLVRKGEEKALPLLCAYLRDRPRPWDVLILQKIPTDTACSRQLLGGALSRQNHAEFLSALKSPFIPIDQSWDNYFGRLKPKFRSNLRNRTKRLQALGQVATQTVADPDSIDSSLADGFRIEALGWKGRAGTAIDGNPTVRSFYTEWARIAAARGWLRLSFLLVGDRRVAFDYSLVHRDRMYCLKIGYDPEFRPHSVGQLLSAEILKGCFEDGLREYDFMGEPSVQKRDWTDRCRPHVFTYVYNRGARARIHLFNRFWIRRALKKAMPARVVAALRMFSGPDRG